MFWKRSDHAECARHRGWVLDSGFERRTCTVANPRALRHALRHALCHGVGQAGGDPGSVNSLLLQPDPNAPGSLTESASTSLVDRFDESIPPNLAAYTK